jgi:hypothetical protein
LTRLGWTRCRESSPAAAAAGYGLAILLAATTWGLAIVLFGLATSALALPRFLAYEDEAGKQIASA